jgi:hypothetical protein
MEVVVGLETADLSEVLAFIRKFAARLWCVYRRVIVSCI